MYVTLSTAKNLWILFLTLRALFLRLRCPARPARFGDFKDVNNTSGTVVGEGGGASRQVTEEEEEDDDDRQLEVALDVLERVHDR